MLRKLLDTGREKGWYCSRSNGISERRKSSISRMGRDEEKGRTSKKTVRKEMVPDWLKEQAQEQAQENEAPKDKPSKLEEERKKLEELKKYKHD